LSKGSRRQRACLARVRPWVPLPELKKEKKRKKKKYNTSSQAWWYTFVIPATQEL
jgi:hypothetical protein